MRMNFTALHRLLGRQPGVLLDEMLDEAAGQHLEETDDLDWKKDLPPAKGITQTDFPKDVAAMANSGGCHGDQPASLGTRSAQSGRRGSTCSCRRCP
jgi:hypothetical protein